MQGIERVVQQLLKSNKSIIQKRPTTPSEKQTHDQTIMNAILPVLGQNNISLIRKLVDDRPYDYNEFKKRVVHAVQQTIKKEQQCQEMRQSFQRIGIDTTTKTCPQMASIVCKTTNKPRQCKPNIADFQKTIQSKILQHQRVFQKIPISPQQHSVPFLFQQDIDKRFSGIDLFYYDEVWETTRQNIQAKKYFFQQQFPELKQIQKDSASPTIIYRGVYKGRDVYVKSFYCGTDEQQFDHLDNDEKRLSYEKEVYRYIRSIAEKDDEVRKHFINMLLCAKDKGLGMAYILSQDSGGKPLNDYMNNSMTLQFFKNIFVQYLYVLYLMHERLHIVHNDLHFGNVLVVKDKQPTKTYTLYGKTFHLENHPYYLMVYDFDQASIYEPPSYRNPYLYDFHCKKVGRCDDYPQTDLYIYLYFLLMNYLFANVYDNANYVLLTIAFRLLLTSPLYEHAKKTNYRYVSCASKSDKICKRLGFNISLPNLTSFLWAALYTDINTMFAEKPSEILYDLWGGYKDFIGVCFFLIKMDDKTYKLTTRPSPLEIERIIDMNSMIEDENISALILPSHQKSRGIISDFLKKQYSSTRAYMNVRAFQQYLGYVQKNVS